MRLEIVSSLYDSVAEDMGHACTEEKGLILV